MSHVCESLSISVTQEILLLAKDSKDPQIRSYAAWAISFLRHHWFAKEFQSTSDSQSSSNDSKSSSRSVAEDSLVWNLCLWLKDNIYNQVFLLNFDFLNLIFFVVVFCLIVIIHMAGASSFLAALEFFIFLLQQMFMCIHSTECNVLIKHAQIIFLFVNINLMNMS